jgi:cation:H+ antiporter
MPLALLLLAFVVILFGAELFTNGIEWLGRKMGMAEGAVGSVFAAVGTALPETMIPVIAILFGSSPESHGVGVGAVLGAPFMLATLAMAITGIVVLASRRVRAAGDTVVVKTNVVAHDVRTFVVAYAFAIGLGFLPVEAELPRVIGAVVLVVTYVWYARRHLGEEADESEQEDLKPLRFNRLEVHPHRLNTHDPRVRLVVLQVIAAVALIVIGATLFVNSVESIGESLGVDDALLALLVAPMATELPEAVNAVIWIRQGKDTLAIGNITGAMVFQATIPTAFALALAPETWWVTANSLPAFLSAAVAFVSVGLIGIPMLRRGRLTGRALLGGGVLYAGYVAFILLVALRPA